MAKHPLLKEVQDNILLKKYSNKFGTPLYIYYGYQIKENLQEINSALQSYFDQYQIYYAVKSNSNPNLLSFMHNYIPSMGADCSSPGELFAANKAGIPMESCVYNGNYESKKDLQSAYDSGCEINLDDSTSFQRLKKIGVPNYISFRLNPGIGKGRFSQIITGGKEAKFGIPKEKIIHIYESAKKDGVKLFGLQCHSGSAILDEDHFVNNTHLILNTARRIENRIEQNLSKISIGSGFGIPYSDDEDALDLNNVFCKISQVFEDFYGRDKSDWPTLCIEPGRSIIGNTCILLAKVTGIKESYKNFIGLDAGMETLMRPALYGAEHRIYKLGTKHETENLPVDITGRICENTDRLAVNISFPRVVEGDLIAIMDAGAYGYAMSNQYNTRPRSAEILVNGDEYHLIRSRETIEDIFQNCSI
jgi:diaminopimelate decarboxylase